MATAELATEEERQVPGPEREQLPPEQEPSALEQAPEREPAPPERAPEREPSAPAQGREPPLLPAAGVRRRCDPVRAGRWPLAGC